VSAVESLRDALGRAAAGDPGAAALLEREFVLMIASEGTVGLARRLAAEVRRATATCDRVSVVTTGLGWLGGGARAIERTLIQLIETAQRELVLAVYAMSAGPAQVWEALERAIDGGVSCTLLINRLTSQNHVMNERLQALRARHSSTFRLLDFVGETERDHLHAKIVVADRRRALVGSANLTAHGMLFAHELAVVIDGPTAEQIAARVEMLGRSRLVRPLS
jgi:phosphatidylserine/phosphatidylglycerophosphate/cardiolipin synthase-like enzyme